MFPRNAEASCRLSARRRLALGGLVMTSTLAAGMLLATPANAAVLPEPRPVANLQQLEEALTDEAPSIRLTDEIQVDTWDDFVSETISADTTLDLSGHSLYLSQVRVDPDVTFTLTNSSTAESDGFMSDTGPDAVLNLQTGYSTTSSAPDTAVALGENATMHVSGARLRSSGHDGGAGIGAAPGATAAHLLVDGGATVYSFGQDGAAGIGGGVGEDGIDVTVGDAEVYGAGGTGAAGIGGGLGGSGGDLHLLAGARLTASMGYATEDHELPPASIIGAGEGGDEFGSLRIDRGARLSIRSSDRLYLPADAVVENQGDIDLFGPPIAEGYVVSGTGTIHNLGAIKAYGPDPDEEYQTVRVDPVTLLGDVKVTGYNYDVTLDANGGTIDGVTQRHLLSGSVTDLVSDFHVTSPSSDASFWKWNTQADGSGRDVVTDYGDHPDLAALGESSTGTPVAANLFARFGRGPAATASTLPDGTVGVAYRAALPVAGDGLSTYEVSTGNSSSDVHPGLPAGLSIDRATGVISGTPTEAVERDVTFYVQGVGGADLTYRLVIAPAAVVAAPVVTPPASADPAAFPVAPVVTSVARRVVQLGHEVKVAVKATSALPVTWSVTFGSLPKGVSLNASTGVISGAPKESGTFTAYVEASSSAGSDATAVVIVVPEVKDLITTKNEVPAVKIGAAAVPLKVAGFKKGERWTVRIDGRLAAHGTMKKAGTLSVSVKLKQAKKDTVHTIRIAGSRTVTDPAQRAATEVTVTSLAAKKTLRLITVSANGMKLVAVERLAAGEPVVVRDKGKVIAKGHASRYGIFTFAQSKAGKGVSALTAKGATATRAGKITVKNAQH